MPIYEYENPNTGEVYEELRSISDRDKPYYNADGIECKRREIPSNVGYCGLSEGQREVFQLDSNYAKSVNPKYVKFRDGHRERYDPTKHF